MGPAVRLVEVGPRDGLQSEKRPIPVDAKVAFVDALSESGLREIEAGAFVSAKAIPQMAGSRKVFDKIKRKPGVVYSALVPNERGLEEALAARVGKISVFTAASETFNRRNINASIDESVERFKPVIKRAKAEKLPVRGYVSTCFYCPFEGKISPAKVMPVVNHLLALGVDELSIGDTIGKASPDDVAALLEPLLSAVNADKVFLHFHDTYGHAADNAVKAWTEFGVSGFDASAGGVGGCPYAPGAAGNVSTEALARALQDAGAEVSVSLDQLKKAAALVLPMLGRA